MSMVKSESAENGRGRDNGSATKGGKRNRNRNRSRSPIERDGRGKNSGDSKAARRVYVANIAFDVKWSDVKDLFREKIGNVVFAQLFEDEQGRSRGCGLVEFNDAASAKKAIEILHRYNYRNRELVVKEDLDCERDRYGRLLLGKEKNGREARRDDGPVTDVRTSSYSSAPPGSWNTYGLSTQFIETLGIDGPLNNRIFVANLDYKVGEKKLEEIFRLAGKVLRVRLYTDSTGQSKGHGTVEFDHPVEAVQAISMFNDQKLYGRPMSIRMDKYEPEDTPEVLPSKLPSGLEGVGEGLGIGGQPLNVSKSLLGMNAPNVNIPAQPAPVPVAQVPTGVPPPSNLNPISVPYGSVNQLQSPLGHSQNPISSQQPTPDPQLSSLNLSGIDTRALSNLVASGALGSFGNAVSNNNSMRPSVGQQLPQQVHPGGQPVSVYSLYESDFRRKPERHSNIRAASDTVVVRNLPPQFNWQMLRNRFNEMGDIAYAELKGPGTAVILRASFRKQIN